LPREGGNGVFIVVRRSGQWIDPRKVPDPLAFENLRAEHGARHPLMKLAMDEISFKREGTEIRMRKKSSLDKKHVPQHFVSRHHVIAPDGRQSVKLRVYLD